MSNFGSSISIFKFLWRESSALEWTLLDPQCFQSGRYRIDTDYYDGTVSIYFDGKWIRQMLDTEEAKRWCARNTRKHGLASWGYKKTLDIYKKGIFISPFGADQV